MKDKNTAVLGVSSVILAVSVCMYVCVCRCVPRGPGTGDACYRLLSLLTHSVRLFACLGSVFPACELS